MLFFPKPGMGWLKVFSAIPRNPFMIIDLKPPPCAQRRPTRQVKITRLKLIETYSKTRDDRSRSQSTPIDATTSTPRQTQRRRLSETPRSGDLERSEKEHSIPGFAVGSPVQAADHYFIAGYYIAGLFRGKSQSQHCAFTCKAIRCRGLVRHSSIF